MIDNKVGNFVRTKDGTFARIDDIKDIHNIFVTYFMMGNESGSGYHCEDKDCPHYDPLEILDEEANAY